MLALVVFLAVAVAVSVTVDRRRARTREAAARAQPRRRRCPPSRAACVRGSRVLPALLDQLREAYGFTGVTLLERRPDAPPARTLQRDPAAWRVAAAVGDQPSLTPAEGDADVPVDDEFSLVLRGHPLAAADRRVVEAFAAQAAVALRQERLAEQAAAVGPLSEVDKMRTALLSAVSHDLRTPLASAKAAVDGLRSDDVAFSDADRDELLATVGESLDRLTRLVDNLLDMSRLQAGALGLLPAADEHGRGASRGRSTTSVPPGAAVALHVPDEPPEVHADPALIERVLVEPAVQRAALQPAGPAAAGLGQRPRRVRGDAASSTTARASRRPSGTRCSCRSSGSATATTTPASGSVSRCPGARRGDGRHPHAGADTRRRADHDAAAARDRGDADLGRHEPCRSADAGTGSTTWGRGR